MFYKFLDGMYKKSSHPNKNLSYPYLGVKVYIEALVELVQAYDVEVKDAHILEVSAKLRCK